MDKVLSEPTARKTEEDDVPFERIARPASEAAVGKVAKAKPMKAADDDDLEFFNKLAEDDE